MGLTVRLQSDPQSLPAALQSGFITITVNVRAFVHWKKNVHGQSDWGLKKNSGR